MKSYGHLWERIVAEENLRAAWIRVRKGHSKAVAVLTFERNLSENLHALREDLVSGRYRPERHTQFRIYDPKPRTISCASVRDRVVHHALCGVIVPLLEKGFAHTSFACRRGKGSHAACQLARRYAGKFKYYCKMDVRHFFDTVDHEILLRILNSKFREREVKNLIVEIVKQQIVGQISGKGLPIGNLTSQWFANFYLDELDHQVLGRFGKGGAVSYIRYMDDLLLFSNDKASLWEFHDEIRRWFNEERKLEVKDEATVVAPVAEGVPFLGVRIFAGCWRLKRARFLRSRRTFGRRVAQFEVGKLDDGSLGQSIHAIEAGLAYYGFRGVLASGQSAESGSARSVRGYNCNNNSNNNATSFNRYGVDPDSNRYNNNGNNNTYLGFRLSSTLSGQCQGPARDAGALRIAETNMHSPERQVAYANATSDFFCKDDIQLSAVIKQFGGSYVKN